MIKKHLVLTALSSTLLTASIGNNVNAGTGADKLTKNFKNVIVMIPDGCGIAHFTLARWYKGAPLACDALNVAQVRTYCSNSYITDSAPAATAFASGYKTFDKYIGILPSNYSIPGIQFPSGKENSPVASVLEGAKLSGRATGVIATSTTSHATPADYTSHWYARSNESIIMEQQVYQGLDVLFGGGKKHILTSGNGGTRGDNENLLDSLVKMGYSIVNNKNDLTNLTDTTHKVWGHFSSDAMCRDFDRTLDAHKDQPSLAQMTEKAIKLLSNSSKGKEKGFFLMVEGSQVDWASHANEPIGVLSEYLAFDSAVTVAINFAKSSGNTLVLVVSDHDNGGLSLGSSKSNSTYSSRPLDSLLTKPLKSAKLTGAGIESYLGSNRSSTTAIIDAVKQFYGIEDLTSQEVSEIAASPAGSMEYALGPIMSKRSDLGWTTTGHTGNDVPLYYYGTNDHFTTLENTDIAWICAKAMNVDLMTINDSLFQKASVLFNGAVITLDTVGVNTGKGSLTVVLNNKTAVLPFNKNEIIVNGIKYNMNGLTIYSFKNHTAYVPKHALNLFNGGSSSTNTTQTGLSKLQIKPLVSFELYNVQGKKITSTMSSDYRHAFAKTNLANGNYLVRIDKKSIEKLHVINGAITVQHISE